MERTLTPAQETALNKRLEATRQALQTFSQLERKSCLAYEFVALKLSCTPNQAAEFVSEVYKRLRDAEVNSNG
jgi:hypothetical protein